MDSMGQASADFLLLTGVCILLLLLLFIVISLAVRYRYQRDQARFRLTDCAKFLRHVRDGWECDNDHYGQHLYSCRSCAAQRLLGHQEEQEQPAEESQAE